MVIDNWCKITRTRSESNSSKDNFGVFHQLIDRRMVVPQELLIDIQSF